MVHLTTQVRYTFPEGPGTRAGRDADSANVSKIDRFRREWETFFLKATDGRMRADTRLR